MSAEGEIRRRPDLWSYISFSRPNSRNHNHSRLDRDPYEKPERHIPGHRHHSSSLSLSESQLPQIPEHTRSRVWKLCGVAALMIMLLLLLAPKDGPRGYVTGHSRFWGGSGASDGSATGKCTKPYSPEKPLIQYALMIDAGSTGSRIHVYRFNNCGPTPELENEVFEQTAKREGGSGLSSYDADAEGAARSLDPLMKIAVDNVPQTYRSCSPIAVKATAGLRKLGEEKSEKILKAVRNRLETAYPFPLVADDKGGVEVMDGKDEGVYAWITANYLLGNIGNPDKNPTAAVFDLGGGSTQIVFEPTFPSDPNGGMPETLAEGDHKYALNFGGREFQLYQHSYLGYGLMAARENLHKLVVEGAYDNKASSSDRSWPNQPIVNPCISPGMYREVDVELDKSHPLGPTKLSVNMTGPASNSAAQCRALAEKTLHKEASCALTPCAFNGVHQPSLAKTFAREDIYLFSYFYDRTQPLGMPDSFTLTELRELTSKVCAGKERWGVFSAVEGAVEELEGRPEGCLDLNFMLALLHTGYEMPMEREVKIAKKIKERELGWCLGASLPLLSKESGWECKIKQIQ